MTMRTSTTDFKSMSPRFLQESIAGGISRQKYVEAEFVFKEIQPNAVIYNTIVYAFCKTGHTSMLVRVYRSIRGKGCKLNTMTYNTLIIYWLSCSGIICRLWIVID